MNFKKQGQIYKDKLGETGVFNQLKFPGKEINIDNYISEIKDNLTNIQTNIELVIVNGDKEKAKANILRSKNLIFILIYFYKAFYSLNLFKHMNMILIYFII